MVHKEQVQRVIAALQATLDDATRGALVMTYESVSDLAVGEVHILSANGTPYPRLVGMLVACMNGVVEATGIPLEQLMDDIAGALDQQSISTDVSDTIH